MALGKGTTKVGYLNKNQQRVIEATELPGTGRFQKVYVLKCEEKPHRE